MPIALITGVAFDVPTKYLALLFGIEGFLYENVGINEVFSKNIN